MNPPIFFISAKKAVENKKYSVLNTFYGKHLLFPVQSENVTILHKVPVHGYKTF